MSGHALIASRSSSPGAPALERYKSGWRALCERGVGPDLVIGTSVGAINGAFIASHPQAVETVDEMAGIWCAVRRGQVCPLRPLSGLLGFLGSRDHLMPESGLRRLISEHATCQRLEQTPIESHVVAVDVLSGEELLLSRGPLLEAVLASAAIPAVLVPVSWKGRALMDGGVAHNMPISHAVALARARCTCSRPATRVRLSSLRRARLGWRCTRGRCSHKAG